MSFLPTSHPSSITENVIFGKPHFSEDDIAAVVDVLRSGWVGPGPKVEQFEREFARYQGSGVAVALGSCSAALLLALRAYGIGAGDEVITTVMTYPATLNAIIESGATPVLADIEPRHSLLDVRAVERAMTSRTKAILPVHLAGAPVDFDGLLDLRKRYGIRLIQDCAHAIEAKWRGHRLGGLPDVACYSFYATKSLTTVEGGMLCTDDPELGRRVRSLAYHGLTSTAWERSQAGNVAGDHYDVTGPGFKAYMTDLQAALGLCQLRKIDRYFERREEIWRHLHGGLAETSLLLPAEVAPEHTHARHLFRIRVNPRRTGFTRDRLRVHLGALGIGTGIHYPVVSELTYYRRWIAAGVEYPNAVADGAETLSLPLTSHLTDAEVEQVIGALRTFVG